MNDWQPDPILAARLRTLEAERKRLEELTEAYRDLRRGRFVKLHVLWIDAISAARAFLPGRKDRSERIVR